MTFPNSLCCFIGLTICFQDIFATSFKSFDDFFCKTKVGTCEANEKLILEGRPPVCYCDVVCVIFNDCCHDFTTNTRNDLGKDENTSQITDFPSNHNLNRTHNGEEYIRFESPRSQYENASKARNNITQYVALAKMDTCLRVDDDVSGFWVVNTCLDKRKRCSESMRMRDVLRHLPVTDHQNVTYFGEECAKCNNVTIFTSWGIMASSYTLSDDLKVLLLLEGIDTGNLQSTLENIGPIQLITPPMSYHRVCHSFSTKDKNIIPTGCPHYQCTTTSELRGDVKGIFRNPDCCISSGRCSDLVNPGWKKVKGVAAIHPWDEIGWLGSMEFRAYILPGSMQKPCDASLNERGCIENCMNDTDSSCIPSKVGICNYPLRDRLLTLALEGHHDATLTRLVMRMISTYLWKSSWFLHDSRFTHVYNSKNGQYKDEERVCTKVELPFPLRSTKNLTLQEVRILESWTERMSFHLNINTPLYRTDAFGVLSRNVADASTFLCEEGNVSRERELMALYLDTLPTEWKSTKNDCLENKLVLKSKKEWGVDVDVMEVYCMNDPAQNDSFDAKNKLWVFVVLIFSAIDGILKLM